jgi:hypothetical protein
MGKPGSVSNSYSIYYAYDIHRAIQIRKTNNENIDPQVFIGNGLHAAKMYKLLSRFLKISNQGTKYKNSKKVLFFKTCILE